MQIQTKLESIFEEITKWVDEGVTGRCNLFGFPESV